MPFLFFLDKKLVIPLIIILSSIPLFAYTRLVEGEFLIDGMLYNSYIVILASVGCSLFVWFFLSFISKKFNYNGISLCIVLGIGVSLPFAPIFAPVSAIMLGVITGAITFFVYRKYDVQIKIN